MRRVLSGGPFVYRADLPRPVARWMPYGRVCISYFVVITWSGCAQIRFLLL